MFIGRAPLIRAAARRARAVTSANERSTQLICDAMSDLIALQYADCTTVRRQFDFRQAAADSAEQALGELRSHVLHAVRIGLEIGFGLIVDRARRGLRIQIE